MLKEFQIEKMSRLRVSWRMSLTLSVTTITTERDTLFLRELQTVKSLGKAELKDYGE